MHFSTAIMPGTNGRNHLTKCLAVELIPLREPANSQMKTIKEAFLGVSFRSRRRIKKISITNR